MLQPRSVARHALSVLVLAALAACGGGGGGGSDGGGDAVATRITITAENAPYVAAQAIAAGQTGFVGEALPLTGVQVDANARPVTLASAMRSATRFVRGVRGGNLLTGAAIGPVVVDCSFGGSVRISGDVADPTGNTAAPGDRLDLTFTNCVEDSGRLDGRIGFTITEVNADLTLLALNASATDFSATVLGVTERVNGSLRIRIDETGPNEARMDISSTRFDFDRVRGGLVRVSRSLLDYDYLGITSNTTGELSETVAFLATGTFPRIGNVSFRATTTSPLRTAAGALHPYAGVAVVTGANDGTVRLSVVANGVRLDVDANGDGTAERSILRTWAQVESDIDAE